jgi:hypothetical protein
MWEGENPTPCHFSGTVCMDRAKLKRAVHETRAAMDLAGSQHALSVAERAYHRALYELANHHCQSVGDEDERSREARSGPSTASASDTPTDIADIEQLITACCELYRRSATAADIAWEYRQARLVLRTRLLMMLAERPPRRLVDILEENER